MLFLALGLEDLGAASIIAVCGWTEYPEHIPSVRVLTGHPRQWCADRYPVRRGVPVAAAGLLRGKRAATYSFSCNYDNLGRLRQLGCEPTAGPIEVSDRIISCAGPAHSIEVAILLLEHLIGADAAREVRRPTDGRPGPPGHSVPENCQGLR